MKYFTLLLLFFSSLIISDFTIASDIIVKNYLIEKGFDVFIPNFPNSEKPIYEDWKKYFEENYEEKLNETSLVIAHSLAPQFVLRYLDEKNISIGELILVAPTPNDLGLKELTDFFKKDFDAEKIKKLVKKIKIFGSNNDPYLPLSAFEQWTKDLNAEFILVPSREHINQKSFPEIQPLIDEAAKNLNI